MPSVSQADGSENLELAELRPSIQGVFEHVRTVKESQARLNAEARSCEHLVGMLEACLAAAEEWERLRSTLANHRSLPPLETRLGLALEAPTRTALLRLGAHAPNAPRRMRAPHAPSPPRVVERLGGCA